MTRGARFSKRKKDEIFQEICDRLRIENSKELFNQSDKTVSARALVEIESSISDLVGIPSGELGDGEREIWFLRQKSQDAFMLALEIVNKVTVPNRLESFSIFMTNAWEALLKAYIVQRDGLGKIFDDSEKENTISFKRCLNLVFSQNDLVRLNLEMVYRIRNEFTHLYINFVPSSFIGIFQASVFNYVQYLQDWFQIDIKDRIPYGMMFLVSSFDEHIAADSLLSKTMSEDTIYRMQKIQESIAEAIEGSPGNTCSEKYYQPIDIKLSLVRNPDKADLIASFHENDSKSVYVQKNIDPNKSHPFTLSAVLKELSTCECAGGVGKYDITQVFNVVYRTKSNKKYCYKPVSGSPQYSQEFVKWVQNECQKDTEFRNKARKKCKQIMSKRKSSSKKQGS